MKLNQSFTDITLIKENDVFRFSYNLEEYKKRFEPSHCFDGQLIAMRRGDRVVLVDTYWMIDFSPAGISSCQDYTPEEAVKIGSIVFVCNLNDLEKANESVGEYYSEEDWFDLSYQHRCCKAFFVKKGARKNADVMRRALDAKIGTERGNIDCAISRIGHHSRNLAIIESGNTDIYI